MVTFDVWVLGVPSILKVVCFLHGPFGLTARLLFDVVDLRYCIHHHRDHPFRESECHHCLCFFDVSVLMMSGTLLEIDRWGFHLDHL